LTLSSPADHSSRKRVKPFKKRKKSRFFEFSKKRQNLAYI